MKAISPLFVSLLLSALPQGGLHAQGIPAPGEISAASSTEPPPPPPDAGDKASASPASRGESGSSPTAAQQLARSNQTLLDLLKKQQAVLEDIQYDRRLQERQINLLEQRLEETLRLNASLEAKASKLEAELADARSAPASSANAPASNAPPAPAPQVLPPVAAAPPPPASWLPPEQAGGGPNAMWWHRILHLSGTDSQDSGAFHISGKQWRVLWHNEDRPGESYKNTSALFISAFPKNDAMPKKICSQLGTGGDTTELTGFGDYTLKIEASGGKWELAVEDFR